MYTLDTAGKRIYTLKKVTTDGQVTKSAHPARFSPDDKYSRSVTLDPQLPYSTNHMMRTWSADCYDSLRTYHVSNTQIQLFLLIPLLHVHSCYTALLSYMC